MSRKGRSKGLPSWYKGKLKRCDISGFWYGELEGKLFERDGKLVDRANFDTLTEKERQDLVQRRMR